MIVTPGKYRFRIWHENLGEIRRIVVDSKQRSLQNGGWTVEIAPGNNDFGEILVPGQMTDTK